MCSRKTYQQFQMDCDVNKKILKAVGFLSGVEPETVI